MVISSYESTCCNCEVQRAILFMCVKLLAWAVTFVWFVIPPRVEFLSALDSVLRWPHNGCGRPAGTMTRRTPSQNTSPGRCLPSSPSQAKQRTGTRKQKTAEPKMVGKKAAEPNTVGTKGRLDPNPRPNQTVAVRAGNRENGVKIRSWILSCESRERYEVPPPRASPRILHGAARIPGGKHAGWSLAPRLRRTRHAKLGRGCDPPRPGRGASDARAGSTRRGRWPGERNAGLPHVLQILAAHR